jgi:uncharacterized protein YdaU (DUF1376 family)
MAQAPIMPVFTDALIGDTTHLSTEEFGAYFLLLIVTWRNNGQALPDDDERLARVTRVSVRRWRAKLRPVLVRFFTINDGCWHQRRLEQEYERVEKLISTRRAAAAAGGKATAARFASADSTTNQIKRKKEESDKPESEAARAGEKNEGIIPCARCARLGDHPGKSPELAAKIREQWLFGLYHYGRRRFDGAAGAELTRICDIALRAGSRAATPREITRQLDKLDQLRRDERVAA